MALVDSGSGLNLIYQELFKGLTFKYPEIKADKELKLATNVNGEIIQSNDAITLPISWGKGSITTKFYIFEIPKAMILGRKFLKDNEALINLKTNTITINSVESCLFSNIQRKNLIDWDVPIEKNDKYEQIDITITNAIKKEEKSYTLDIPAPNIIPKNTLTQ